MGFLFDNLLAVLYDWVDQERLSPTTLNRKTLYTIITIKKEKMDKIDLTANKSLLNNYVIPILFLIGGLVSFYVLVIRKDIFEFTLLKSDIIDFSSLFKIVFFGTFIVNGYRLYIRNRPLKVWLDDKHLYIVYGNKHVILKRSQIIDVSVSLTYNHRITLFFNEITILGNQIEFKPFFKGIYDFPLSSRLEPDLLLFFKNKISYDEFISRNT